MKRPSFHRWSWAMSYAQHLYYVTGRRMRVSKIEEMWEIVPARNQFRGHQISDDV